MKFLGVNVDHVATLREARRIDLPDPVEAAVICEIAGAHSIVAHLREDRRHIKERDIKLIKEIIHVKFNLEMAPTEEILKIALEVKPHQATLVPERREEVTTEGGLDVARLKDKLKDFIVSLKEAGIKVSLFIDPEPLQVESSKEVEADSVELHTGDYANAKESQREEELKKLKESAILANRLGMEVHAGHGLNYSNVQPVAALPFVKELNIGHSIISRAVFVGLEKAVKEMLSLINAV